MRKLYKIKVNGKTYKVELQSIEELKETEKATVAAKAETKAASPAPAATGEGKPVNAPIQGTVINIKVKSGDKVKKGDVLLLIEAMKLENEVVSPSDGVVGDILVTKGTAVTAKQPLLTLK